MPTVGDIYRCIDAFAPFSTQESWDNSGLLVGDMDHSVRRVCTALDISKQVIDTAVAKDASLIVSHHPVIFSPLKQLSVQSPVYQLAEHHIDAICVHTPLDMAAEGLNSWMYAHLQKPLALTDQVTTLEPTMPDGGGFGWIADSTVTWTPQAMAKRLQVLLECPSVRYSANSDLKITKIAYCSGSGASMLELAAQAGCQALITGDIKHDRWIEAEFLGVALFDCGHYGTEHIAADILEEKLRTSFPGLDVITAGESDPVDLYIGGNDT